VVLELVLSFNNLGFQDPTIGQGNWLIEMDGGIGHRNSSTN
jgi:hypothetical protein